MKLGIIGLEGSGKTTVFNALTGSKKEVGTYGKLEAHIAIVKVPDERIEHLAKQYEKEKIVYADIEFIDIPGNINDSSDPKIVASARETDALIYVLRAFENPNVPHPHETINPLRDLGYISMGLIVADMSITAKRIEKLKASIQKFSDKLKEEKLELEVLEKVMTLFEEEEPASEAHLTKDEEKAIRSFQLLTLKPFLALINVSENDLALEKTKKLLSEIDNSMAICASLEMEIENIPENEREAFLKDFGITELSINRFIKKAYETLGLISFFTIGEKEVHAWTIPKGTSAVHAAGKIHTDMERGFIRAEVFSFDDLKALGSEKEIKSAGKFRLESKDYIVQDGDILKIKFNV